MGPKFFSTQNFLSPKILFYQIFFNPTFFDLKVLTQNFLDPTFFRTQHFFPLRQTYSDPKFFSDLKFFQTQKFFWAQIFCTQHFFKLRIFKVPKKFWGLKIFDGPENLLDQNFLGSTWLGHSETSARHE